MVKYDLLLIDIESTGLDVSRHEIIQLAAILLDKKTLKEKRNFNSYIKPMNWVSRDHVAMAINKIDYEQIKNAQPVAKVIKSFVKTFPGKVTLANYGGNLDTVFLPAAFKKASVSYPYDYNTLNIWVLAYVYMIKMKKLGNKQKYHGFNIPDILKTAQIPLPKGQLHDALVDCRAEAEILRHIIKRISI